MALQATSISQSDRDRLLALPGCGLVMLDRELALAKLKNLCAAAAPV